MMILLNQQRRNIKMSIIKDIRNIYKEMPKQQPVQQPITPVNIELMDKIVGKLNQKPQIVPEVK